MCLGERERERGVRVCDELSCGMRVDVVTYELKEQNLIM